MRSDHATFARHPSTLLQVGRAFGSLARSGPPPGNAAPGPRGIAAQTAMRRDPVRTLTWAQRRFGDVVRLQLGPDVLHLEPHVVSDVELVRQVLGTHAERYVKPPTYSVLRTFLGDGLVTSEGEVWQRHRRMVAPVFERRHVEALDGAITAAGEVAVERLRVRDGTVVDVSAELSRATLHAVGGALFGADLEHAAVRIAAALDVLQHFGDRVFDTPMTWPFARVDGRNMLRAVRRANAELDAVVAELLERPLGDGVTLLGALRRTRDDRGVALTPTELRDELVTFILAGHETTSLALTWSLIELARRPEVLERLRDEVRGVLGDRIPTSAEVPKLGYTAAVLQEAMRLHPPAWIVERATRHDEVMGGYDVPAGTVLMLSPYVLHRHADHWDCPEAFDPGRFLGDRATGRHRYAYVPFGAGRRQCVGAGFAMLEATLLLSMLVRAVDLDLLPGRPIAYDPAITLRVRGGLLATVRRR